MEKHQDKGLAKATKMNTFFDNAFIAIWGLMFIVAANFLVVSLGGNGLALPPNPAVWACIAVLILFSLYKILLTDKIVVSTLLLPLFILSLCLIIPGLLSAQADTRQVLLRVAQVAGFFLLFFSISQYQFSVKKLKTVLYLVMIAAVIQIIYVLAQKYHNPQTTPAFLMLFLGVNKPPVGGFLQVNALSIFLVTSILVSFFLLVQESIQKSAWISKLLLLGVCLGGGYVLALISSRAALLALGISLPLFIISSWNNVKAQKKGVALLVSGLLVGLTLGFMMDSGINRLEHKKISSRLLAWSLSVDAIKEAPLTGHGLGGFAKAFFDQIEERSRHASENKVDREISLFTHPHNEILYWGVESGIVAIFAIVFFCFYYLFLLFKTHSIWQVLQYLSLLTPIGLSTQVSLPFYLSSLLMVLFVFLLLLPFQHQMTSINISLNELIKKVLIIIFGVIFVLYLWFIKESIQGGITITRYVKIENSPLSMVQGLLKNPYWGKVATSYAHQYVMNGLLQQGNKKEARKHLRWFEDQLAVEEEPMYFEVLLVNYPFFGESDNYKRIREKVINRYPNRFNHYLVKPKITK